MDKKLMEMPLDEKKVYSKNIIKEAFEKYGSVAIAFSGRKDSTTLLHLTETLFNGKIPCWVFTLDTGAEFKEITEFTHRVAQQ